MARGQNGVNGIAVVSSNDFIDIEHARTLLPSTMAPNVKEVHMITKLVIEHAALAVQVLKQIVICVFIKEDIAVMNENDFIKPGNAITLLMSTIAHTVSGMNMNRYTIIHATLSVQVLKKLVFYMLI